MNSKVAPQRSLLYQPILVLLCSITGAALYGFYLLRSTGFKPSVLSFSGSFFYVVPIIVPFVAFLFDRAEQFRQSVFIKFVVDVLIVGTAVGRLVAVVPFISGHTLFLTYGLFTSRSRVVRISAVLVMLHTVI